MKMTIKTGLLLSVLFTAISCSEKIDGSVEIPIPEGVEQVEGENSFTIPVYSGDHLVFDGVVMDDEYAGLIPIELTYGEVKMKVYAAIYGEAILFAVVCHDPVQVIDLPGQNEAWAPSDGLNIYFDPNGLSYNAVVEGLFRLSTIADGGYSLSCGRNDGKWIPVYTSMGIRSKGHRLPDRYLFEISIPLQTLGVTDISCMRMGYELKETSGTGISYDCVRDFDKLKPCTWCKTLPLFKTDS